MKNNKNGITLIALVITIIVLLILGGISISLVTGQNGVLTRAENASNTYSMASAKEQANMRAAGYVSEYMEKVYVDNDLGLGAMTTGEYVLSQINGQEDGDYRYSVSGNTITVTSKTTGETLATGTVDDNGGIAWSDSVASTGNGGNNSNSNTNNTTNTINTNTSNNQTNNNTNTPNTNTQNNNTVETSTELQVKYAVQIYGINQDVDINENTLGLTFGPAMGANYNNAYVTHTYEETSNGSGVWYVKIITHTISANGTESESQEYLLKNGETDADTISNRVTRTTAEKNEYDVNLHTMTWTQIAAVSDKTKFTDCMLCGDTKSVSITISGPIKGNTPSSQSGDGAGVLLTSIDGKSRFC